MKKLSSIQFIYLLQVTDCPSSKNTHIWSTPALCPPHFQQEVNTTLYCWVTPTYAMKMSHFQVWTLSCFGAAREQASGDMYQCAGVPQTGEG